MKSKHLRAFRIPGRYGALTIGRYDAAAAAAKSLQSCPTLCDPIDGSPPGSDVPGILQARTLEWVAISFSNAWKWKVKVKLLSRVWLCDPMDCRYQAPPSMGFSRQEYWSGVPLPSPRRYDGHTPKHTFYWEFQSSQMNMREICLGFPDGSEVQNLPVNVGDDGLILGSGRSPGGGNGNSLQYSCWEISCWEISWTEKSSGLQSMGLQNVMLTLENHRGITMQKLQSPHFNSAIFGMEKLWKSAHLHITSSSLFPGPEPSCPPRAGWVWSGPGLDP